MAHDLNNLLAVVLSATEVLATDACEGDRKVIAAAGLEAARRAADLLQGFLADEGAADRLETPCSSTDVLRSAALLGALSRGLAACGLRQERRALVMRPADLVATWLPEPALELTFSLNKGLYATVLIREICEVTALDESPD